MNLVVFTDGASRGNPGPASYGFVIKSAPSGEILYKEGKRIGINTNNFAEYTGVLRAFEYIKNHLSKESPHAIELAADSQLVIRQLSGLYKIKSPTLGILLNQIKELENELGEVTYKHIPREQNKAADALANQALDKQ